MPLGYKNKFFEGACLYAKIAFKVVRDQLCCCYLLSNSNVGITVLNNKGAAETTGI